MSVQSFLINNGERNPNEFIAKIGRSLSIPPNSEICVNKLSLRNIKYKSVNSSNDTFVIMWGQNGLPNKATSAQNNNQTSFMPAETIKLNHGSYKLYGSLTDIDDLSEGSEVNYDNIANNLIKSISEQSKYFMWGWASTFSTQGVEIMPYLKARTAGFINFNTAIISEDNMNIIINAAVAGASPSNTEITNTRNGYAIVGSERVPFPYDTFLIAPTLDEPRGLTIWTLDQYDNTDIELLRGFGGYILDEQEYYKNNESYNIEKDWIGFENEFDINLDDPINTINLMPISWEIEKETNQIMFIRREIVNNSVGDIVENIQTGIIYNGTNDIEISFQPNITPGNPVTDTNKFIMNCVVKVAANPATTVGFFDLDQSYFGMDWRNALVWSSIDNDTFDYGTIDIFCSGIDESKFITNVNSSIGPISGNAIAGGIYHMGNISATLFMTPVKSGTVLNITPETTTDYIFQKFTEKCNCNIFQEQDNTIYNIDNDIDAGDLLQLDMNYNTDSAQLSLNIDNLPINNYICNPENGKTQKRIFTIMNEGSDSETPYSSPIVINPFNLNWNKLNNMSPIVINNFQIRFSNLDGSTSSCLESNVDIEILIKSNTQINYRATRGMTQKIETIDQTENNFKIAQNVF